MYLLYTSPQIKQVNWLCTPGIQEDELHVQAGSEHEHVAVQLDLGDGAGRQGVTHGHQTHVLVAALKG